MRLLIRTAAIALFMSGLQPASAEVPGEIAAQTIAAASKLDTADAIQFEGLVDLGGIKQWISVRGRHRTNPIILVLHGGPGFTASPVAYWYMRDWEEYFTVVQWDQRGAGRTYAANDPATVIPTLTLDRMTADAGELIQYLRSTYHKDKLVLLGHSFGSLLGLRIARQHPDWLYAYVGMGQFIDFERSEKMGYEQTLADARAAGDTEAVAQLEAIAPYPDAADPDRDLASLGIERRWLAKYGGYYAAGGTGHNEALSALNPAETAETLRIRNEAQFASLKALWGEIAKVNYSADNRLKVPIVLMQGRHDRGTSSAIVGEWFDRLQAPGKQLVWFEDSAHMVYEEEPGKTLVTLANTVRPLTYRASPR